MNVGTKVMNQEPTHPLTGVVIATPDGQSEPDGWIWVAWSNGLVCEEYPDDVTVCAPQSSSAFDVVQ